MSTDFFRMIITAILNAPATLTRARLKAEAFTRTRSMPFTEALKFMLDMSKNALQVRLNRFFKHKNGGDPISQQAFSKLRANFDHSPFETMFRAAVAEEYSGRFEHELWNGYQ